MPGTSMIELPMTLRNLIASSPLGSNTKHMGDGTENKVESPYQDLDVKYRLTRKVNTHEMQRRLKLTHQ